MRAEVPQQALFVFARLSIASGAKRFHPHQNLLVIKINTNDRYKLKMLLEENGFLDLIDVIQCCLIRTNVNEYSYLFDRSIILHSGRINDRTQIMIDSRFAHRHQLLREINQLYGCRRYTRMSTAFKSTEFLHYGICITVMNSCNCKTAEQNISVVQYRAVPWLS